MIIGHRNYRSYDEVMIKLPYDEFVTIYDHHNIFRKYGHWCFFACLFNVHYLIFLSMVHEYAYFLWIYLEIGLLSVYDWLRRLLKVEATGLRRRPLGDCCSRVRGGQRRRKDRRMWYGMKFGHYFKLVTSHTRPLLRGCFIGDEASQWKRPKFDPSPR